MAGNTKLVQTMVRIDAILQYPVFALSCIILFLSVKVVPSSLARMYCTNIAVQSFMCTSAFLIGRFCLPELRPQDRLQGFSGKFKNVYVFLRASTMNGYLYFSTLTVFLAYIGYARPLLFSRLTRRSSLLFLIGYLWTFVNVILELPRDFFTSFLEALREDSNFAAPMWLHVAMNTALYGIMIALYVMTISQIQSIRRVLRTSRACLSLKRHWNTLKSILIYCTPPNVFMGIALAGFSCDSVTETFGWNSVANWENEGKFHDWLENGDVCSDIRIWSQGATNVRLFVSLSTALLAFREYRLPIVKHGRRLRLYLRYYVKLALFKMLPTCVPEQMTPPKKPKSFKTTTVLVHTVTAM